MKSTCWLIDATGLLFRSYYGMRPMEAPDGTPIAAVYGLGMSLQRYLNEESIDHVALVFDAGSHTFRNRLFDDYKANRGAPPEDLIPQFDLAKEFGHAMGLPTYAVDDYEADDVLATFSGVCHAAGHPVVILSGDKDLSQLLRPGIEQVDPRKNERWGPEGVVERMGVRPEQIPDLLGLMGDSSDNIPGVPGVGKVAATALLSHFEDLEAIYADLEAVEGLSVRGAKSLRKKLEENRPSAEMGRRLARLVHEVPMGFEPSPGHLLWEGADATELTAFADRWGLARVASRIRTRP